MSPIELSPLRPSPALDPLSEPFFEALRQGRFALQACRACGVRQLARHRCVACGERELLWQPASGQAVLVAVAEVCANDNPHFNRGRPYNIAVVELQEGPQLYSNIVHVQTSEIRIGMQLQLVHSRLEGGVVVPVFEPAQETSSSRNTA